MARFAGLPLVALVLVGALYGAAEWFRWQAALSSALLVLALSAMAWLTGSTAWRADRRAWWSPTVWMATLYVVAAALVFVDAGLGRHVPSAAILATFLVAPLPWALLGAVGLLDVARRHRKATPRRGPAPLP